MLSPRPKMTPAEIRATDAACLWHPYAAPGADVLPVSGTHGVHLTLADGRRLIDAMSSWWSTVHGHRHPRLMEAAHHQLDSLPHVMFGGLTHEPAVVLANRLRDLLDSSLTTIFYSDSGSVAVEVAIKMAMQYSRGIGRPERTRLLTWRSGYHGDTFAAMSVCDPDGGMHSLWAGVLTEQVFAPAPPVRGSTGEDIARYLDVFSGLVDDTIAAVIIEPLVQGAGGMRFHDEELLRGVRSMCDEHGILLIADEIATGFGRTGHLFATHGAGVVPDIMTVGKALTGGTVTLAATITTNEVAQAIASPAGGGALMHGPTFMANPLACAVAAESVALIAEGDWCARVQRIERELLHGLAPLAEHPLVADVRVLGAIGVVEMTRDVDMACATAAAVAHGVWLRPFGRLVYTMPAYISTSDDIAAICAAIAAIVEQEGKR